MTQIEENQRKGHNTIHLQTTLSIGWMTIGKIEHNYEGYHSKASVMEDNFRKYGPIHLTCVDWTSANDRKSVAASLVNGVYTLERDRIHNRQGEKALASVWWSYFQFNLVETLKDNGSNGSIFAAVFEYKGTYDTKTQHPPRYVLAFRGTLTEPKTVVRDLFLDAKVAFKRSLSQDFRCQKALDALKNLVSIVGPTNIWLVGHSLGATLALQIGKLMAQQKCYIHESYLFNPPFPTIQFDQIFKNEKIKMRFHALRTFVTGKLSHYVNNSCWLPEHDPFLSLCMWTPHLFVHPNDPICCGYISYFEFRKKMESMGLGEDNKVAMKNSIFNLITEVIGSGGEAMHLIPSARVTKNLRSNSAILESHRIHQWWQQHSDWHYQQH